MEKNLLNKKSPSITLIPFLGLRVKGGALRFSVLFLNSVPKKSLPWILLCLFEAAVNG